MRLRPQFEPRDWQERFVREYQTNTKKNFLVEACVSAGKTAGALYSYSFLKDGLDWRFLVAVVPSEHLKRQYAQDAKKLFGLNLYYSGTSTRIGRLPTPRELRADGYEGLILSYQWLTKPENAESLRQELEQSIKGKVFLILDEVHHASEKLAFGQACETAFPDNVVSHRLMTSGTPFRSDQNRILGNWVNYDSVEDNVYECVPDFRYTLAEALREEVVPGFSFVVLGGEFTYNRGTYSYEGRTFTDAQNEQELTDALNTAIYVEGGWIQEAIEWAHSRMKRDRANKLPECATYVRASTIQAARNMKERIFSLTGERALVVVSRDDDPNSNFNSLSKQKSSQLIEQFAKEVGAGATSWIIGVGMLGEGVSINRLKYRIHATNIRKQLSFIQDLGRLLRRFPDEEPEAVETLIPAHPELINLALDVLNEVAHVVREEEEDNSEDENTPSNEGAEGTSSSPAFQPIASTGEFATQIVEGEEIADTYTKVAEWAIANKEIWRHWGKTPAHLAQMLQGESDLFELLQKEYETAIETGTNNNNKMFQEDIPDGFPSEYAIWLNDEKRKYASKEAHKKAQRLAYILYPDSEKRQIAKAIKEIHTKGKRRCEVSLTGHIGHKGWERIYLWLLDRIAHANQLKGTEDL